MNNVTKIFGGPGCGKTTELMRILEKELLTHDPDKIAYVSFTRKGTYEGMDRAIDLFGYSKKDLKYFRTLHSIAFTEGGHSKYDMISKKDYKHFSESMGMNFTGYYTEDFHHNDDRYLFYNFMRRNNPEAADKYTQDVDIKVLKNVLHNYKRFKEYIKAVDFTDIIEGFVARNESLPVEIAIIDEAQDLTTLQWEMCQIAFRDCEKVYIAGDDDQAIYEWSGADVNMFLDLSGKEIVLDKSHRLKENVLKLSTMIAHNIGRRVEKNISPLSSGGNIYYYNDIHELEIDPNETYYFLARNNWFLKYHRNFLMNKGIVFRDKTKLSYDPKEIRAINNFEILRKTRQLTEELELSVRRFLKGKLNMQLPWYDNLNFDNDKVAYYRDLIKNKSDLENINVDVNTIHGVKGGEADNVVLLMDFTKAVDANYNKNIDSELRCLYVGVTRTKKNLHIIHSQTRRGYDNYLRMEV